MQKLFIKRIYAVYVMKNKKWILFKQNVVIVYV